MTNQEVLHTLQSISNIVTNPEVIRLLTMEHKKIDFQILVDNFIHITGYHDLKNPIVEIK